MMTIDQAMLLAANRHNAGALAEAESIYRQVLAVAPRHCDALRLLGFAALQRGQAGEAVGWLRQAVEADPSSADARHRLGQALRSSGRPDLAAAEHARAFALDPKRLDALTGLGLAHAQMGRLEQAAAAYRAALGAAPADQQALFQLAQLLTRDGPSAEAAERYRAAARAAPDTLFFYANAGIMLRRLGRWGEALDVCRLGLIRDPADAGCLIGAGESLLGQDAPMTDTTAAAAIWFGRATRAAPTDEAARDGLGRALERTQNYSAAELCFASLVALAPQDPRAQYNLGMMRERRERMDLAVVPYGRAWRLDPGFDPPWEKIVNKFTYCDWRFFDEDLRALIDYVDRRGRGVSPLAILYLPTGPETQLRCAQAYLERTALSKLDPASRRAAVAPRPQPKGRLTIGYLSGDFRDHAVAFLVAELFELHDRNRFQAFGYSTGPDGAGQPHRRRLEAGLDRMTDIRDMSAQAAAQRIRDDGVDILVDLSGHTRHNRYDVLALRPAPLQINYLGYPGTSGADFMDAILVDPVAVPPEQQPFYTERLVYLPNCYQANDRKRPVAEETPSRAECGLPEDGVVFCSFNNAPKILPETFDVWMRLLKAQPDAVLWLLHTEDLADDRLRQAAADRGVDPARVVFAPRVPLASHLARYRLADLFLDTWPYNAHTTASDSLWVGCPVLTVIGETFPARVAASLLTNVGLPELIARSPAEYEATALALARDPARRLELRRRLAATRDTCPLFDTPRFVADLEAIFLTLWREKLASA